MNNVDLEAFIVSGVLLSRFAFVPNNSNFTLAYEVRT